MQSSDYHDPEVNQDASLSLEAAPEKLLTLSSVAETLGIPVYTVRRAANNNEFPTYRMGRGRRRARLSEVLSAIEAAKAAAK